MRCTLMSSLLIAPLAQSTFQSRERRLRSAPCAGAPFLVFDALFLLRLS